MLLELGGGILQYTRRASWELRKPIYVMLLHVTRLHVTRLHVSHLHVAMEPTTYHQSACCFLPSQTLLCHHLYLGMPFWNSQEPPTPPAELINSRRHPLGACLLWHSSLYLIISSLLLLLSHEPPKVRDRVSFSHVAGVWHKAHSRGRTVDVKQVEGRWLCGWICPHGSSLIRLFLNTLGSLSIVFAFYHAD